MQPHFRASLASLCALSLSAGLATATPTFQGLGDLPGGNVVSFAFAVSRDGSTVVGQSSSANGQEAFRWRTAAPGMTGLGDLPGGAFQSAANATSADGSVVVGLGRTGQFDPFRFIEGFRWSGGPMTGLGQLPGAPFARSVATGVSGDGATVVGLAASGASGGTQPVRRTSSDNQWQPLPDLAGGLVGGEASAISTNGQVIVGWTFSAAAPGPDTFEATRWVNGVPQGLGGLPGQPVLSAATRTNTDGGVVVGYALGERGPEAFRFALASGTMQGLGYLGGAGQQTIASGVSGDGQIVVGEAVDSAGASRAFIWNPVIGLRDLREYLVSQQGLGTELAGWTLSNASDVSADGTVIVGTGINPQGRTEAFRAVINAFCRVDFNADGELTFDDVQLFVGALNANRFSADLNEDGEWTFDDIQLFIARFNAGC